MIGVTGILRSLPSTFPLESHENSGNMVHGDVPFQMFDEAYLAINRDWPGYKKGDRFRDFVNDQCSHVIITCANVFRANDFGEKMRKRYLKFAEMLEGYNKPVVIFGLGVQAKEQDLSKVKFPPEAIAAMKAIAKKATAVSVRGTFTLDVLKKFGSVENAYVTGCPSFFSRPQAFKALQLNIDELHGNQSPRLAFSGTHHSTDAELKLMADAIRGNSFFIEPQDRANYQFYTDLMNDPALAVAPPHFRKLLAGPAPMFSHAEFTNFISLRLRLFRDLKPWMEFNGEFIDFTYGTRFHVNMASVLCGKPALWITHDSRTSELAESLSLPSLDVNKAADMSIRELISAADYEPLFKNLPAMFNRFNRFLDVAGLPNVLPPNLN